MASWLFRNRSTGRITVAQLPNASLALFFVLAATRWFVAPTGAAGAVLDGAAGATLALWSIDEILRGVNPFRRIVGAGVLVLTVVTLARSLT